PTSARYTEGRFLAQTTRFLDPELYNKGIVITVAGTVTGAKTLPLGETTYRYPVITIRELEVWTGDLYRDGDYYYRRPQWWGPYYGPYYHYPYPYRHYRYHQTPGVSRDQYKVEPYRREDSIGIKE
ncbi:MAG: hypothetical protein GF344_01055, partial [Chitinivibrionales bacterium]|nr:hypothetical protein [Chitinivibrionales bacterium]MBD3355692.1 hypothetical protein [Chitinivibrionales bacterium]